MSFSTLDSLQTAEHLYGNGNILGQSAENGNEWALVSTALPTVATTPGTVHTNDSGLFTFPSISPIEKFLTQWSLQVPANPAGGAFWLLDRLVSVNQSVTTTGVKTINSSALTRYTTGMGVMVFVEVQTINATNAVVLNLSSYTDQDGDTGHVGASFTFPSTAWNVGGWGMLPLAAGDAGARSVESIEVTTASTGAGAVNIVLAKPLWFSGVPDGASASAPATLADYPIPRRLFDGASLAMLIKGYSGAERTNVSVTVALDS